jgi:LmbE family N-acetylglucosaminyl deacetylase
MSKREAYARGDEFSKKAVQYRQPLFVIAHQDDELPYGGLIQRLGSKTRFVWVTNGDGLYFEGKVTPKEYGEIRKAEAIKSVAAVGIPEKNTQCLDFSEVEIYKNMSELYSGKITMAQARPFFQTIRDSVKRAVFEIDPDAVFTDAYQGGQPEHDLSHFFTMLAVRDLVKIGKKVDFFHLPEYEYTILLAMRFHPLYKGVRNRIKLSPQEFANKSKMVDAYPSQVRLFGEFQKVFTWIGKLGYLTGGPKNAEEYMSIEEFGPVPETLDYERKPHTFDYFTYMFDDFEGVPVTFSKSILPIVNDFLKNPG